MKQFSVVMLFVFVSLLGHSTHAEYLNAEDQFEITFWHSISDSKDTRDFEDYLERYPNGGFVTLANRRLADIKTKTRDNKRTFLLICVAVFGYSLLLFGSTISKRH